MNILNKTCLTTLYINDLEYFPIKQTKINNFGKNTYI